MPGTAMIHQRIEADLEGYTEATLPPLQHQWPVLGQELFALEHTLTDTPGANQEPLTEQEKREKRAAIRHTIVAQMYRDEGSYTRDTRYLAFLLVKAGRGGVIVGNPYAIGQGGKKQELPYTGLEGYYAGSQQTPERPGMTPQAIIQEEADIGAHLLGSLKKHAIEQNSWITFTRLKRALEGEEPGREELRTLQLLWSMIVRQLHVRIYRNVEFELTLSEQLEQVEQLAGASSGRTMEEKHQVKNVQVACNRLKEELEHLSAADKEREKQEKRSRQRIRAERLAAFQRFREETYQLVTRSGHGQYRLGVQDASLEQASIVETITLPAIPRRQTYPPTAVHFTQPQLEGYLFLAKLGETGGDPLARSVLVSP